MNSRHRFPANEYRSSNSMSSKMSPETLTRSQSLHRSDNSGNYWRFRPRNFPPRRSDLFIEAGRLAVDYLISHGLLPSDALSTSSSHNNNGMKKSNIPESRDPMLPSVKGKPEQDITDEGKASSRQIGKSPVHCSSTIGNHVGEDGKDGSSMISHAHKNDPSDIGTGRDVNLSKEQQQRNSEVAGASNVSKQESAFMEKEAVAAEEKMADAIMSNLCKEDDVNKIATMGVSAGGTDTACCSELIVPVMDNALVDGSSAGSACKGHNPVGEDKGEKRALGEEDAKENTKKAKQWPSVSQFHENLKRMASTSDKSFDGGQDLWPAPPGRLGIEAVNLNQSCGRVAMLPKDDNTTSTGPSVPYSEKQFFPSSFKICDLNLMEVSDNANESHDAPALPYSSLPVPAEQVQVDVDLSMGSNSGLKNEDKAIDVIDLEGDSVHGDRNFHSSIRRTESGLTGLDNFPNHAHNSSYNPDTQDGYGLMISELIGNDIPSCPPVQSQTNPLHSDISLHPGDNILSDDDHIYMTLGDIPITGLLRGWDQPNQDY